MPTPFLEIRNVTKAFGSTKALDGVNLTVNESEVLGLLGDNGAGKSTLIKIISGVHAPDSGEILISGRRVSRWGVADARRAGIETVYQDKAIAPNQSISRNIFMGREQETFGGSINLEKQRTETERLMREIGFTSKVFTPESIVGTLSGGEREGIAIARAMYFKARLLILDEPTTALSLTESEKVFSFVRRVKREGCGSIFISHNIYHAYDIADRLVILDRGRIVDEVDKTKVSVEQLIRDMQAIARTGAARSG
ncbi:MAG TPA: ATP-binding cassette domain-containing protein [Spirochaetia bacterium]|nr:ATP-binding cassette domain-containing protein [Spirochaetia bacterium]